MRADIDGHTVLFDDDDIMLLFNHKWRIRKWGASRTYYAESGSHISGGYRTNCMHHLILGRKEGYVIDHINGNGLDNRRANLRHATIAQNNYNAQAHSGKRFKGTYFYASEKKPWNAQIQVNKKIHRLGRYDTEIEAARAYNEAAKKFHGQFAKLNNLNLED